MNGITRSSALAVVFSIVIHVAGYSQMLVRHTATTANTHGHITTIDNTATNGKPNAVLIVSQNYGTYNANEIGVWYSGGKWKIFNENRAAMPLKNVFNILVIDPKDNEAFIHVTSASNTSGHITTINNAATNGRTDIALFVSQHFGKYNTSPVGVWYSGGKWKIYNENRQAMPIGTRFNVLALKEGDLPAGWKSVEGNVFQHRVTPSSLTKFASRHVSYINNKSTNNDKNASLFATQNYKGAYNTSITGVWYDQPNWTVFNQDRKAIPQNIWFNILNIKPAVYKGNLILTNKAVLWKGGNKPKTDWRVATRVNASTLFILPYADKKTEDSNTTNTTEIQGPNLAIGKDINTFFSDEGFNYFVGKLNIFRELYEDKNPRSGYFYYLPRSYNLKWDRETGEYSFYIYYLSADGDGRGDVIVTAELTPNISRSDISVAETLLSRKLNKEIRLRPLPLNDSPKVSFGNALNNFDVDDESVSTNVPTDFLEPIVVSWRMDRRVDDFIGAMMNNLGIAGNIDFAAHGDEDKIITVPVRLKVNDHQTYGKLEYAEASGLLNGFYNTVDYPLVLRELVVLRDKGNRAYSIQTIPLGNYEVEPKTVFSSFNENEKRAVLNGDIITKMWVDYSVKPCDPCNTKVQSKIMGGTSNTRVKKIEVEVLTPLEYAGANSMKLLIKSRQGDPNGETDVILPIVTINHDGQTVAGGELFIAEGIQPDYEYQMVLINPDGETMVSSWIQSNDLYIIIGENTIREHFESPGTAETEADGEPRITDGN